MQMKLEDNEVGMFLGGLLSVLVLNRAHEIAGDMSDEDWLAKRAIFIGGAYDEIVTSFPEPLRTKLRASRDSFLATALRLN